MDRALAVLRSLWQHRVIVTLAVVLLLVAVMLAAAFYALNLPQLALDRQQTLVFGPTQFAPENPASVRVLVRDQTTGQPMANADIAVRLQPKGGGAIQTLYTGKTDASGTAPISFRIPADVPRDETLIVETSSSAGRDRVEKAVTVQRTYKVLVTTDKPLYQPGQIIHIRALALAALDRTPAKNLGLDFLVEDPKGNKIYRKTITTSDYGVASADFALADTLNAGTYKITASMGDTKSEKSVTVKPYVLPKFKVSVETDRAFYLPSERVTGRVRADYFFGKPVAKSDVTIKGVVYDVARAETVNLTGKTDDNGVYAFSFALPNYFAGRGLDKNRADFGIEVSVTDLANHTEQQSSVLAIASDAIQIDAVPESGKLVVGVENILYVLTALPDGSPVECDVSLITSGTELRTHTGKYGIAEVRLTPRVGQTQFQMVARDTQGRTGNRTLALQSETTPDQILLRADSATYRVGDTMHLAAFSSGSVGTVYLDIIKEGQTLSTRAIDVTNGRANADVDVTADMIGALQLHAYHVERDSTIVRDTRVVVVEQPSDLNIAVQANQDTYRPGDNSHVTFNVTDSQGKGVQSALGVSAVDESVFALAEQDPGFAKLYFLLTNELLDPKYQVKGWSLDEVVEYQPQPVTEPVRVAQTQSAQAAWAGTTPFDFILRVNSQPEKIAAANKAQAIAFNGVAGWLAVFLSLIPLGMGGLIMAHLREKKILGQSMAIWMGGIIGYCIVSLIAIPAIAIIGGMFLQAKLGMALVALFALAWLVAFGVLVGYAIMRRNELIQVSLMLLVAYIAMLGMLFYVGGRATVFTEWQVFAVIMTYLAGLGVLVLLSIGLFVQKEVAAGFAALLLALLIIPITIWLALLPSAGPFLRAMGHPGIYMPPAYLTGCSAAAPGTSTSGSGNLFRDLEKGFSTGAPAPTAAPPGAAAVPTQAPAAGAQQAQGEAAPRLRQYFPETLYFNPQVITDEKGQAALDIPLADSITTWRLGVMASSQRGELGAKNVGIRVFQDFFVDLDLPVALTQNDEISIPVAVYNYLQTAQKVKLQIEQQPWFTLQDDAEKTLTIASNDISVVYFRIKAMNFGMQKLKVTALGDKMSDAIQREIQVYPDGKAMEVTWGNWLKGDSTQGIELPGNAIQGASRVEVKIYPGMVSQVLSGLDGMLKMPYG